MFLKTGPVITSLLDVDYYKLTMMQLAWKLFRDTQVTFAFTNRTTSISLPEFISVGELVAHFEYIQKLQFTKEEIDFLRDQKIFGEAFLQFLKNFHLPTGRVGLKEISGVKQFDITATGNWPEVTLWETIVMSVVNHLYFDKIVEDKEAAMAEGFRRLEKKVEIFKQHPEILFAEFGTRRRFTRDWQEIVVRKFADECPENLLGTSNVLLAKKLGLKPIGTFAHEMDMVYSGIYFDEDEAAETFVSHDRVLKDWWELYGFDLSTALSETYGTDYFFNRISDDEVRKWKGFRQDSGDPLEWGEKMIKRCEAAGADPREKLGLFSDGLTVQEMLRISDHFKGRLKVGFGWGTNATNDMGFKTLSIVMKAVHANGHATVKLSDNLAKAQGPKDMVERAKRFTGYTNTYTQECVV